MSFNFGGYNPSWGSHIPILIDVFNISEGAVLELGTGLFSTPLLHALCLDSKRKLVSYENYYEYYKMHLSFENEFHELIRVYDWDKIEIENKHWGLALVDHRPAERRTAEIKRLANNTDFVVIHDSGSAANGQYRYDLIYPLFKWRFDYILNPDYAYTSVLSNATDLTKLKTHPT